MKHFILLAISILLFSCSENNNATNKNEFDEESNSIDLTNKLLSNRSPDCTDYIANYFSNVIDISTSVAFNGNVSFSSTDTTCVITSDAIPNHNFNHNSSFATAVAEQSQNYTITRSPQIAAQSSDLAMSASAVFMNGVKLDILPAACYGVGNEALGNEKIGCGPDQIDHPWRYDPMSSLNNFGTDENNAHTQPNGAYHYHGNPLALFDQNCESSGIVSPVIGFAADGFPIFGSCFDDNGTVRKAVSSYALISGVRQPVSGYADTPEKGNGAIQSNEYDGQFRGDWVYQKELGDLDECSGMTVDGQYGYYVTDSFPWVMNCFKGTPNSSFM